MDFLKKIAPTVAAALVGPAGGIAVEVLGQIFGWEQPTKEKVEDFLTSGQLSSEDVAKIRMAEMQMKEKERELGFRFEELATKDRQAEHKETQDTIRSGDNAEDPYVRHTRPMVARQSWYGMGIYVAGMEVWKAVDASTSGADWQLALLMGSPMLAYMGFRSIFDKFGLTGRILNRK